MQEEEFRVQWIGRETVIWFIVEPKIGSVYVYNGTKLMLVVTDPVWTRGFVRVRQVLEVPGQALRFDSDKFSKFIEQLRIQDNL